MRVRAHSARVRVKGNRTNGERIPSRGNADSITVTGVGKVCLGSQTWLSSTSTQTESLSVPATNKVLLTITDTPTGGTTGNAASNFAWSTSGGTVSDLAGNATTER